jgi:hypothetical protein
VECEESDGRERRGGEEKRRGERRGREERSGAERKEEAELWRINLCNLFKVCYPHLDNQFLNSYFIFCTKPLFSEQLEEISLLKSIIKNNI